MKPSRRSAQEWKRLIGIYSTHSDESYVPTDGAESKEKDAGIYDVDEALEKALAERGVEVELDTTTHLPHDAGAYRRSRSTAARLLKSQPAALLDMHRDGVPDPERVRPEDRGRGRERRCACWWVSPIPTPTPTASSPSGSRPPPTRSIQPDRRTCTSKSGDSDRPARDLLEFRTHTYEDAIKSTAYMADVLRTYIRSTAKARRRGGR